jgi:hypothetical protein
MCHLQKSTITLSGSFFNSDYRYSDCQSCNKWTFNEQQKSEIINNWSNSVGPKIGYELVRNDGKTEENANEANRCYGLWNRLHLVSFSLTRHGDRHIVILKSCPAYREPFFS